jgi:hypothetical protein
LGQEKLSGFGTTSSVAGRFKMLFMRVRLGRAG